MKVQTLYALTLYALTLKAPISKNVCFDGLLNNFEASLTNSVDAIHIAPVGAVRFGSHCLCL